MSQPPTVTGTTCGHCEMAVRRAVKSVDPQAEIKIDRTDNLVEVDTDQPREAIAAAIREEGYQVSE